MPNDLEALLFLSTHFIARDEPLQACDFAERAHSLKPLDKAIGNLLWSTYVKGYYWDGKVLRFADDSSGTHDSPA